MSPDTIDPRAEGRAAQCGSWAAHGWGQHGGGSDGVVATFWPVTTPSLSLSARGPGDWPSGRGERSFCRDHAQDPRLCGTAIAGLCDNQRADDWRDRDARRLEISLCRRTAWLRCRQVRLDYAFDRLLTSKLQQAYEILAPDRVRLVGARIIGAGEDNEDRRDLRPGVVGPTEGGEHDRQPDGGTDGVRSEPRLQRRSGADIRGRGL